jgi:hypothetical protein
MEVWNGNVVGRSQAADAGNKERSQHTMPYTLTSTPTLNGVSPSVGVPWSCRRMLCVQWHTPRHGAAGVKGLAVLTAHGDDQFNGS